MFDSTAPSSARTLKDANSVVQRRNAVHRSCRELFFADLKDLLERKNWAALQENSLLGRSEDKCRITEYVLILRVYVSVELLNVYNLSLIYSVHIRRGRI